MKIGAHSKLTNQIDHILTNQIDHMVTDKLCMTMLFAGSVALKIDHPMHPEVWLPYIPN